MAATEDKYAGIAHEEDVGMANSGDHLAESVSYGPEGMRGLISSPYIVGVCFLASMGGVSKFMTVNSMMSGTAANSRTHRFQFSFGYDQHQPHGPVPQVYPWHGDSFRQRLDDGYAGAGGLRRNTHVSLPCGQDLSKARAHCRRRHLQHWLHHADGCCEYRNAGCWSLHRRYGGGHIGFGKSARCYSSMRLA